MDRPDSTEDQPVIHKILDKIDRIVTLKRANGELDHWIENGGARRYCKRAAIGQQTHHSALLLYVQTHARNF